MRTLVFGGTGMLGREVVAEGRRRGFPTLGLSHLQGDVTLPEVPDDRCRAFRPELVVNCAAFTRVDDCEGERERAFAVNARGSGHVAAAAAAAGARLLHVSTDYVFDGKASCPYREDAPTGPLSVYGESKLAGEAEALAHERSLVVRTSWLFGLGGGNFVATLRRLMVGGQRRLQVVADQTGCPTYAPFLARALWDLAPSPLSGVVHYRNRGPVTWHAFAEEIARLTDPSVEVEPVGTDRFPRPARRPAYSVLDVSRCEEALGRLVEPWSLGLAEFLLNVTARATT